MMADKRVRPTGKTLSTAAAQMSETRYDRLDEFRIIAMFAVIVLHMPFPALDIGGVEPAALLRLLCRWAVPFFFMLTGFFLKNENGFPRVPPTLLRTVLSISLAANLLYLPVAIAMGLFTGDLTQFFSLTLLATGTWFHLWFLQSMVLGLLVLMVLPAIGRPLVVTVFAAALVLAFYLVDVLLVGTAYVDAIALIRQFQAFAFMWFGFLLGNRIRSDCPAKGGVVLLVGGIILTLAEFCYAQLAGIDMMNRQIVLGTVPITFGVVLCCSRSTSPFFASTLADWGRRYVLLIYILHPFFIPLCRRLIAAMPLSGTLVPYLAVPLVFLCSLALAFAIQRFFPKANVFLRGMWSKLA